MVDGLFIVDIGLVGLFWRYFMIIIFDFDFVWEVVLIVV